MPIIVKCDFCEKETIITNPDLSMSLFYLVQSGDFATIYIGNESFISCMDCNQNINDIIEKEEANRKNNIRNKLNDLKNKSNDPTV